MDRQRDEWIAELRLGKEEEKERSVNSLRNSSFFIHIYHFSRFYAAWTMLNFLKTSTE
jgi:hypothetical protein